MQLKTATGAAEEPGSYDFRGEYLGSWTVHHNILDWPDFKAHAHRFAEKLGAEVCFRVHRVFRNCAAVCFHLDDYPND